MAPRKRPSRSPPPYVIHPVGPTEAVVVFQPGSSFPLRGSVSVVVLAGTLDVLGAPLTPPTAVTGLPSLPRGHIVHSVPLAQFLVIFSVADAAPPPSPKPQPRRHGIIPADLTAATADMPPLLAREVKQVATAAAATAEQQSDAAATVVLLRALPVGAGRGGADADADGGAPSMTESLPRDLARYLSLVSIPKVPTKSPLVAGADVARPCKYPPATPPIDFPSLAQDLMRPSSSATSSPHSAGAEAPPLCSPSSVAHVVMVVGAKAVGKSMVVRYIVNTLLGSGAAPRGVVLVDADVGQPETGPLGVVGASVVTEPLLGGSVAHNQGRGGVWVGDIAARGEGRIFTAAVERAVAAGLALAAQDREGWEAVTPADSDGISDAGGGGGGGGGNGARRAGGRRAGDGSGTLGERRRHSPTSPLPRPLVINTPGWMTPAGRAMLLRMFATVRPNMLVRITAPANDEGRATEDSPPLSSFVSPVPFASYTFPPWWWRPAEAAVGNKGACPRSAFFPAGWGGGAPGWSPIRPPMPVVLSRVVRELSLAAYFAGCLASGVTYAAPLSALTLVTGGVSQHQAAGVLNGSVVGLGTALPFGWEREGGGGSGGGGGVGGGDGRGDGDRGLAGSDDDDDDAVDGGRAAATMWDVVGLGVVRAVDVASNTVYVATPVGDAAMADVHALVMPVGGISLCAAMMMAVAEAAADRAAGGTGVWDEVSGGWSGRDAAAELTVDAPYVSRMWLVKDAGAGPMLDRRTLFR